MGWKNLPAWVKGGTFGALVPVIIVLLQFIFCMIRTLLSSNPNNGAFCGFYLVGIIWQPWILLIYYILGAIVYSILKSNLNDILKGSLIGAIIALAMGTMTFTVGFLGNLLYLFNLLLSPGFIDMSVARTGNVWISGALYYTTKIIIGGVIGALIGFIINKIKSRKEN